MKLLPHSISYNNCVKFINHSKNSIYHIGCNEIGSEYIIPDHLKNKYNDILLYFLGFESSLDPEKGLALIGKFGVGKTTIFNVFHRYLKETFPVCENLFIVSSIEEIANEDDRSFIDSKYLYNVKQNERGANYRDPKNVLINEFGHEYNIKKYGTDINEIIEMFIMKRYDIYQQYGKVTHITSNLDLKMLKNSLHPRILDRFKEMFNFVEISGESRRK